MFRRGTAKEVGSSCEEEVAGRLYGWLGLTEGTTFRIMLLYLPITCALPGWIVIVFTSDGFPNSTLVFGIAALVGYLLLASVQARWVRMKALSKGMQALSPGIFFTAVFSISCLGVGILWSIPFGVGVLNAVLIYMGTIFFGIVYYTSTFKAFRAIPEWRTLTLRSIALFSILAVLFLLSFSYFIGAFH